MRVCAIAAALGAWVAALSLPVEAMPIQSAMSSDASPYLTLVAQGCGYGRWRGPWGHCRSTPYYGPLPGGGYKPYYGGGCPPGWWRGPWGHCRHTPYHGRLPDGGYQ